MTPPQDNWSQEVLWFNLDFAVSISTAKKKPFWSDFWGGGCRTHSVSALLLVFSSPVFGQRNVANGILFRWNSKRSFIPSWCFDLPTKWGVITPDTHEIPVPGCFIYPQIGLPDENWWFGTTECNLTPEAWKMRFPKLFWTEWRYVASWHLFLHKLGKEKKVFKSVFFVVEGLEWRNLFCRSWSCVALHDWDYCRFHYFISVLKCLSKCCPGVPNMVSSRDGF